MSRKAMPATFLLLACSALGPPAVTQQPAPSARGQILVLGTYHFDNPGLDIVKMEVADVLGAARQKEIAQVAEALARFAPTRIAVEVQVSRGAWLDSLYAAYRAGNHQLGRNEVQQLGFRLARRFNHPRLYPVDHRGEFPFGAVMEYAQQHDPGFVQRFEQLTRQIGEEQNRWQREKSIGEILRLENDPERIAWGHAMYVQTARVAAGDTYVGADLLTKWYARNIRIFADVQKLALPGDRVLLIVGAGHAAILRELIRSDPALELVEANRYLPW